MGLNPLWPLRMLSNIWSAGSTVTAVSSSSMPAVAEATSGRLAVVRFHGRNTDTWEAKVAQVSQRFRYLYDETELRSWLPGIRAISEQAEEVHLVFNNCYGNYATTNALETAAMLLNEGYSSNSGS